MSAWFCAKALEQDKMLFRLALVNQVALTLSQDTTVPPDAIFHNRISRNS